MRISENKNVHRPLIAVALVAALVVGAFYIYKGGLLSTQQEDLRNENTGTVDYSKPTEEQVKTGNEAKKDFLDSEPSTTPSSINITSVTQSGELLQVRTTISSVNSPGRCTLSASRDNKEIYSDDADTQSLGSYSVCKGFDIPLSGLEKGEWSLKITFLSADNNTSLEASKQVQVE
jgi:hypothetical protein